MKTYKVVLIDDEAPARNLLKQYLKEFQQLVVVAECKNGIEAIEAIDRFQPDLIFLDIQMPGKDGFEVLQEVSYIPTVIFSTAFDEYALKAFEVNAVDYLLKPYTKERLNKAVQKVLADVKANHQAVQNLTESFIVAGYPDYLLVEWGNKLVNIKACDILWIKADGDYTRIHLENKNFLSKKSMNQLEQQLNPGEFQRIHRSAIVSVKAIKEVHRGSSGPHVVLQNNTVIKISRSYTGVLKKFTC